MGQLSGRHTKTVIVIVIAVVLLGLLLTGRAQSSQYPEWWNTSWQYRVGLEINASDYSRVDWPVEHDINFTSVLNQLNVSGTFDANSTRVLEYNSSGYLLHEVASQFDPGEEFNASANAVGTIIFLLNGTTQNNTKRYYEVYFDTTDRQKQGASYPAGIDWIWDGEELNVNNTVNGTGLRWHIDTLRGENTSGLYWIIDSYGNNISFAGPEEKTIEYMKYSNETHNFSFDFGYNLTFRHAGPVRLIVEQKGNETVWNQTENVTGEGLMVKRYTFYSGSQWILIEQNFTNTGNSSINRSSTPAGALGIDVVRAGLASMSEGNNTEPGSWQWFASELASSHIGVVNINSTGGFWAENRNSTEEKMGIEFNTTTIPQNGSVWDLAALHVNSPANMHGSPTDVQIKNFRNRLMNPVEITQKDPKKWETRIDSAVNHSVNNRGETVNITSNVTFDPYELVGSVNATLEGGVDDNVTIILYDDGTHGDNQSGDGLFTSQFNISDNATIGVWNVTIKAYDSSGQLLNESLNTFNVTETYNVTTVVINPSGLIDREVNATIDVRNYRLDKWISNATINCSWYIPGNDPNYVENYTDYGNGTYLATFLASPDYGTFTLNCTANKSGNIGWGTDIFYTEMDKTNVSMDFDFVVPGWTSDNITVYSNQSFEAFVNSTNAGNGTANDYNLTLTLPGNWTSNSTFEECGNVYIGYFSTRHFLITIPNATPPGNYIVDVAGNWTNPDSTQASNQTFLNVTVLSNPRIDVPNDTVPGIVPAGEWGITGNFSVGSVGNDNITNITFTLLSGDLDNMTVTFSPPNMSSLAMGQNASVQVNVSVPSDHIKGLFTGNLNITTSNDGWDNLTIEVMVPGTNMSAVVDPENITADNVSWYEYQNFTVIVNTTNTGNATAFGVNLTLELPEQYWITNATNNTISCGKVNKSHTCSKPFLLSVIRSAPAIYSVNATIDWLDPGIGTKQNKTVLNINVTSNPRLTVVEDFVAGPAPEGNETILGNFTVVASGNDMLTGISMNVSGLDGLNVSLDPPFTILFAGENQTVTVNITVPEGYPPGNNSGTVNVTSYNDGFDSVDLNVTVPDSRTWEMYPLLCEQATYTDEGEVCAVRINNTGNLLINFTITPDEANHTYPNETNFSIENQSFHVFSVWWNVTGEVKDYYNATYLVDTEQNSTPQDRELEIRLSPYAKPEINLSIPDSVIEEFSSTTIYANVTDKSGGGIASCRLNVTRPTGEVDSIGMLLTGIVGDTYLYYMDYPAMTWGSTDSVGDYNFTVFAWDAVGMMGNKNETFHVYPVITENLSTGWSEYFTGQSGSIYYTVTDGVGVPLVVNTTLTVYDSSDNLRFNSSYQTNTNGTIRPVPIFQIPSDAPTGNYLLESFSIYSNPNITINKTSNYTFQVAGWDELRLDIAALPICYATQNVRFLLLTKDGRGRSMDVDNMSAMLYDKDWNTIIASFSVHHQSTGLYWVEWTIPQGTTGQYFISATAEKDNSNTTTFETFMVLVGGPFKFEIDAPEDGYMGKEMDFEVNATNEGNAPTESLFTCWIDVDGSNQSTIIWQKEIGAGEEYIVTKSIVVPGGLAEGGTYQLWCTLDALGSPYNTTYAVDTFIARKPAAEQPPDTGGEGPSVSAGPAGPPPAEIKEIEVLSIFPDELMIERGGVVYVIVEIKNVGERNLNNILTFFDGVPTEWFDTIRKISILTKGSVGYLITRFEVPEDTVSKAYPSKIKVLTFETEIEMNYSIEVFESKEELLRARVKKAWEQIDTLERDAGEVGEEGGDVTRVILLLQKARDMLMITEKYLEEGELIKTTEALEGARNVLDEVRYRLSVAKPSGPETIIIVPLWVYAVIAAVIILAVLMVEITKKKMIRNARDIVEKAIKGSGEEKKEEPKAPEKASEGASPESLEKLKKWRNEGLISEETYNEMKKKQSGS